MNKKTNISLDSIANAYSRYVSTICYRMIQNEEIAKEASQQVWVEIVKSFPNFKNESNVSRSTHGGAV